LSVAVLGDEVLGRFLRSAGVARADHRVEAGIGEPQRQAPTQRPGSSQDAYLHVVLCIV
jgi:hypothetical protein